MPSGSRIPLDYTAGPQPVLAVKLQELFGAAALLALAISPVAAQEVLQSYIVVFRPGVANVPEVAAEVARAYGGERGFVYEHALKGFSIKASPQAATAIASNPLVAYVEKDMLNSIDVQTMPTGIQRIFADDNTELDIDGTDDFRVDVDVAVIDTGIDWQHTDLNVVGGINCAAGNIFRVSCNGNGDDDHYHGTHVAGTIAALDNGIGVVGVLTEESRLIAVPAGEAGPQPPRGVCFQIPIEGLGVGCITIEPFAWVGVLPFNSPIPIPNEIPITVICTIATYQLVAIPVAVGIPTFDVSKIVKDPVVLQTMLSDLFGPLIVDISPGISIPPIASYGLSSHIYKFHVWKIRLQITHQIKIVLDD